MFAVSESLLCVKASLLTERQHSTFEGWSQLLLVSTTCPKPSNPNSPLQCWRFYCQINSAEVSFPLHDR